MMKDTRLLIRLKEYVNYASTAESNLAHYITEDPQAVIGKSIHELARLTYTSPSTIVRFCRKMGFQGYREFQQGLMYETALYHESRDVALQDITPKDSTRNVIRKVTSKNVESLRITEKLLDPKVVDACVELLTQCRLVALFGLGASLLAAQDLQLKLLRGLAQPAALRTQSAPGRSGHRIQLLRHDQRNHCLRQGSQAAGCPGDHRHPGRVQH